MIPRPAPTAIPRCVTTAVRTAQSRGQYEILERYSGAWGGIIPNGRRRPWFRNVPVLQLDGTSAETVLVRAARRARLLLGGAM